MSDDIGKMLFDMINSQGKSAIDKPLESNGKQAEKLLNAWGEYSNQPDEKFKSGDLIVAKDGLAIWKTTANGRILVITDVITSPKRGIELSGGNDESHDLSSPYAPLLYDIVAGFVAPNGQLVQHMYDSRHFKRFNYSAKDKVIKMFGRE